MKEARPHAWEMETLIEAYETMRQEGPRRPVADFFLPRDHRDFADTAVELLRVDLEYAWEAGERGLVRQYRDHFPEVLSDPRCLALVAFEEYRLRCQSGEEVDRQEYARAFSIDIGSWPDLTQSQEACGARGESTGDEGPRSVVSSGRLRASGERAPLPESPQLGDELLGFRMVAEIGHGAFSRVYLGQQDSLANRLVVLKLSNQHWAEAEMLARLQHANIVPIYSVHRTRDLQIVCMPFLGFCTLHDVLRSIFPKSMPATPPASGAALMSTVANHRSDTLVTSFSSSEPALREQLEHQRALQAARTHRLAERLERCSYLEACLWMMAEMADGLAHAHQAGILHRDLKPANILITDDGRPMLLDFNLSEDLTVAPTRDAAIGGTLPYMAPEHLRALRGTTLPDAQSDIYSLGVILYEMLSGRRPFPDRNGPFEAIVTTLESDRHAGYVPLTELVRGLPHAVASIVDRCLAPQRTDRYATADQLREDVLCQLQHRPLRFASERSLWERAQKWTRRHPRLSSMSSVATVAAVGVGVILGAWHLREQTVARNEAQSTFQQFQEAYREARLALSAPEADSGLLEESLSIAEKALATYPVAHRTDLEKLPNYQLLPTTARDTIRRELTDLDFQFARVLQQQARATTDASARRDVIERAIDRNERATQWLGHPLTALTAQSQLLHASLHGDAQTLPAATETVPRARGETSVASVTPSEQDLMQFYDAYSAGLSAIDRADWGEATAQLDRAIELEPMDFAAWLARGKAYAAMDDLTTAETCFTTSAALRSSSWLPYFHRGLCHFQRQAMQAAEKDFARVLERRPDLVCGLINRALARKEQRLWQPALDDLNRAIQLGCHQTRVYWLRATIYDELGNTTAANRDREQGATMTPRDELSWVSRGMSRAKADPQGALADLEQARRLNPHSYIALRNAAAILSDQLQRPQEAIPLLDEILRTHRHDSETRAGRGVLQARCQQFEAARADAVAALEQSNDARTLIHVACIYALTAAQEAKDADRALELIHQGLRKDPNWAAYLRTDPDLQRLHDDPRFEELIRTALRLIQGAAPTGSQAMKPAKT